MRIFFSHSSRNKPLVREVKRHLPENLNVWIDEKNLLIGEHIEKSLQDAIQSDSDFVVIFIDNISVKSEWVKKELEWALEKEREIDRIFVLPIVLEREAWDKVEPEEFQARKFLSCTDYDENTIKVLANALVAELFSRVTKDLDRRSAPAPMEDVPLKLLDDADRFVAEIAEKIRLLVYPHRRNNPLEIEDLFLRLKHLSVIGSLSDTQFNQLLVRLRQQGYLSGLVYTGQSIFVDEEHYNWKTALNISSKKRIANRALTFIKSNSVIALDAGSTTLELSKYISQGLKMRVWDNLKIVTNSISAANELLTTSSEMGLGDKNHILQVYIVGGRVRPNTLASVNINPESNEETAFASILQSLNRADISFIGANGISMDHGFTTHDNSETQTKADLLKYSEKKFIMADSSKFGIREEVIFATFDQDISVITEKPENQEHLVDFERFFESTTTKIIYA